MRRCWPPGGPGTGSAPVIALCYGTRPQVIKASVLRRALAGIGAVYTVDTGQHYDFALNELLYQQLAVAAPDEFLEVGSASHAEQTALILTRVEAALQRVAPRIVVAIGDTNSTLGVALAAAKLRIPVVHVEAGLRARDRMMAEELNRRAVDAIASLLCTPCRSATERMRAEHPHTVTAETGDVSLDVLQGALPRLPTAGSIVPGLASVYIFATLHRAELTDDPKLLHGALRSLEALDHPVVLAVHPRTRERLVERADRRSSPEPHSGTLTLIPAVGYLESLALTRGAAAVVTDSGGLQREAYWLGTPCVTLRQETEWEETLTSGANHLVPPTHATQALGAAVEAQLLRWADGKRWTPDAYGSGHAAEAVTAAIEALP